ncbi:MAG: type IV pilus secretin PilQ [Holophagaceae bacterium]|nr:type IV pilus secretin PilQ [Holophagaceae bacterium]
MNARLSSLLVAGGVVLAGIHPGSLHASPALETATRKATLVSAALEPDGVGARLLLRVPGLTSRPGVQVLPNPARVVVDLPGVDRGTAVTRQDLNLLMHPLIQKVRLAQFTPEPKPVTRMVLEVVPGTQVLVEVTAEGVQVLLTPGEGRVQARFEALPRPQAPVASPVTASEVVSLLASFEVAPLPAPAPVITPEPAPVVVAKAVPPPVEAPAAPAVVAEPKVVALKPLAPLPAVGGAFQLLPQVAAATLLPVATPNAVQVPEPEKPRAAAPIRSSSRTLGESQAKYTGSKITIDLQNTEIRDFIRILADTGKLNLVMDPDVQGSAGFKFTDTPWDQVLDVVLKNSGLGKEVQNGVLRVAKVDKLQKEEEERKKLDEIKALAGELQTITRPLSYAKVGEVQKILKDILSKRGSAILDERTNTLIITDLPHRIPVIEDLIQTLDVQIQQVQIEARVVEANKDWQRQFGVKWPTSNNGDVALTSGGTTSTTTPWVGTTAPFWNGTTGLSKPASGQQGAIAWNPGKDGVTSIAAPAGELWLSFLSNRFSINAVLQALESEGTVKIVSSPKIVTQNNKKATILSGEKIPYPTQQGGAQGGAITVAFIDANLQLDVTPQITNEGTIIMDIKLEKAEADFSRTVNGTPTILRKALETQMLVRDGGTAVLGGVYITNSTVGTAGVPFLAKLPIIGFLFRKDTKQEKNAELLIFITPRILRQ